jgi:hypothetical protein
MTITSAARSTAFNGNGSTTVFPFEWKVFATTDVRVVLTSSADEDTELTYGTHYTVALNDDQEADPGGAVTVVTAPASGETLTVISDVPYTQEVDLVNGGAFNAEVIEAGLDRITIQVQQLKELIGDDPLGDFLDAVGPAERADRALGFDADGNLTAATGFDPGALVVSAFMETVLDDATAADARATLGVPTGFAATAISYSDATSELDATTVQEAIDNLDAIVDAFAGSVPAATLQAFTTPGTATFTVPSGCNYLLIEAVGGGGGGGSGAKEASRQGTLGGYGGGPAGVTRRLIRAPAVGTDITVTVGAGGSGGAAVSVTDTDGNAGGAGGLSAFGGYVLASGGAAGAGGKIDTTALASHTSSPGATGYSAPGGGGGGASQKALSPYYFDGSAGGDSKGGESTLTTASGGAFGTSGTTGTAGTAGANAATSYVYGSGGGGGGFDTDNNGYAGGAGGYPGGGGGGGGAAYNTGTSGAGGAGGRGEVRVWYW